jgi:hypothetical protein
VCSIGSSVMNPLPKPSSESPNGNALANRVHILISKISKVAEVMSISPPMHAFIL